MITENPHRGVQETVFATSRTENTQSSSFQAITDLKILDLLSRLFRGCASSTWVQAKEQYPRPSQLDFSEACVNKQPGPGQEQVWISSFSPGTGARSASTLWAGSTVTHQQGWNLPPQPSPPAAFKPAAQHWPAKGNMTRGSGRVWFAHYFFFFFFKKRSKTQPLSAIRNTHFIRKKLPAVFFRYNMWTRDCQPALDIYRRLRAGSLRTRRARRSLRRGGGEGWPRRAQQRPAEPPKRSGLLCKRRLLHKAEYLKTQASSNTKRKKPTTRLLSPALPPAAFWLRLSHRQTKKGPQR